MRFLVASLLIFSLPVYSTELPSWIKDTKLSDASNHYIVCSHSALDPEDARQTAEGLCLASAAKLGGVLVTIKTKTISSLTGVDSSEVAEVQPLVRKVRCDFTDRFQTSEGKGYRVYLRCRVKSSDIEALAKQTESSTAATLKTPLSNGFFSKASYKRAIASLTMLPKPDKVIVGGDRGERVFDPSSNSMSVEIKEGDIWIESAKHGYKSERVQLGDWKHGQTLSFTISLTPEMTTKEEP